MATKTLYLLNTAATTPDWNGSMQDGGSAPAAANSAFGWTVAKTTAGFWKARIGATALATTTSTTSYLAASGLTVGTGNAITTAGDTFGSPTPYTGQFAAGNWTLAFGVRPTTVTAVGLMRCRVYASTSNTGAGARELTTAVQVGTSVTLSSTTTTGTSTVTWNAPVINLNNEYLFIQCEWNETTAGTANGTAVVFYQSAGIITTTNWTPTATAALAVTQANQTVTAAGWASAVGTLNATQAAHALSGVARSIVGGALNSVQADQALAALATVDIGGVLNRTEANDTLSAAGDVTGGTAPWTPADLGSDLILWLDGADAATITITGSGVSAWANKAATPTYTVQSLDANRPQYSGNAVHFTDPQVLAVGNPPSIYDFFVVGTPNDSYNWRTLIHNSDGHNLVLLQTGAYAFGTYNEVPPYFRNAGALTWPVVAGLAYGSIGTGEVFFSRDGGALTGTTCVQPVDKTTVNFIGAYYSVANNGNQGFGAVNEFILVTYNASDDTRQKLEGYAAWKWGLQALLPVDHPYVSAPPGGAVLPPITGTLAAQQDDQTLAGAGRGFITAALNQPQASQSLTGAAGPVVRGLLGITQANHTIAASGAPTVTGSLSLPQAAQTLAGAGKAVVNGVLSLSQANHALAAAGGPVVRGALNVQQNNHTLSGLAFGGVSATLSTQQTNQTLAGAGAVGAAVDVVLLVHCDGTNGQTSFTDASSYAHALTATSVEVNTANPKFGTGDAYYVFGNVNASIDAGSSPGFWFDAGPFTIEAWCWPNSTSSSGDGYAPVLAEWGGVLSNLSFFFNVFPAIQFFWSPDGTSYSYIDSGVMPPLSAWSHVAVDRDASGALRLYLNGAVVGSGSIPASFFHSTFACQIGNDNTNGRAFPGALDEIRVVKGTAMYGGAFTPPTAPFLPPDQALSGIAGTLNVAQAAQTLTAASKTIVGAALNAQQANHTLSATGALPITATLNQTQSHSLTATAKAAITATLNASQTQSLTGVMVTTDAGALHVNQADQTLVASGKVPYVGTLNAIQANQALVGAAMLVSGSGLNLTQANQTLSAIGRLNIGCALNLTQAPQGISGVAKAAITGTLTELQASQTLAGVGGPVARGVLTAQQDHQTIVGRAGPVAGLALGVLQQSQIIVGRAGVTVGGALTRLQQDQMLDAAAGAMVNGALRLQQDDQVFDGLGEVEVEGRLNLAQQPQGLVGSLEPIPYHETRVMVMA